MHACIAALQATALEQGQAFCDESAPCMRACSPVNLCLGNVQLSCDEPAAYMPAAPSSLSREEQVRLLAATSKVLGDQINVQWSAAGTMEMHGMRKSMPGQGG